MSERGFKTTLFLFYQCMLIDKCTEQETLQSTLLGIPIIAPLPIPPVSLNVILDLLNNPNQPQSGWERRVRLGRSWAGVTSGSPWSKYLESGE